MVSPPFTYETSEFVSAGCLRVGLRRIVFATSASSHRLAPCLSTSGFKPIVLAFHLLLGGDPIILFVHGLDWPQRIPARSVPADDLTILTFVR